MDIQGKTVWTWIWLLSFGVTLISFPSTSFHFQSHHRQSSPSSCAKRHSPITIGRDIYQNLLYSTDPDKTRTSFNNEALPSWSSSSSSLLDCSPLGILNGRVRDVNLVESTLHQLKYNPSFLSRPNALTKTLWALDNCRAKPEVLLYWWKELTNHKEVLISPKAIRSLLA